MLVISRKKEEQVTLLFGDLVLGTISILGADRGRVRIGFEADKLIRIVRTELIDGGSPPAEIPADISLQPA